MSSTHHISRLQYKVSCPDEEQAFALRHLLSATATSGLAETMQLVCDRCVQDDHFIRIPKLEIHLEAGSVQELAGELAAQFAAKLEAALHSLQVRTKNLPYEPDQETGVLLHFLEHGSLPHWGAALAGRLQETAAALIRQSPERTRQFLQAHARDHRVWMRVRTQLSAEARAAVVSLLPALAAAADGLYGTWTKQQQAGGAAEPVPYASAGAIRALISEVVLENAQRILLRQEPPARLMSELAKAAGYTPAAAALGENGVFIPEAATAAATETTLQEKTDVATEPPDIASMSLGETASDAAPEKQFTRTAGLVLLHPFLKPFFTGLGLLDGREWVDEASRHRAVHLLHYLATGLQEQGEWNLLLEKLLCGLAPPFPIERHLQLTAAETAECDALLAAVIGHWTALKNTSPRGLREMFLQRDGLLLKKAGEGWQLLIEKKTADVLLEALPWGLSLVKPVWNDYTIEVTWS